MSGTFGKGHHLHLIDGSAFIFRAFHALPPLTRKSDGIPIGAVAGFCNMVWKMIQDNAGPDAPTHAAVIFDKGSHTFRNEMYDQYKANRDEMPEDLRPQIPLTRKATEAFNIACKEIEGFEADDIIATLAVQARAAGGRCTIISSDKDLMQLVGDGVEMLDAMKNTRIDRDGVFEKFGVYPERVVDVQALAGINGSAVGGAVGGTLSPVRSVLVREIGVNVFRVAIAAFDPALVLRYLQPDPWMAQRAFPAVAGDAVGIHDAGLGRLDGHVCQS